jgi:hypothetical protein
VEAKAQEGIGSSQRLIAEASATDSRAEQSPEGETQDRGGSGNTVSGSAPTTRGHRVIDEMMRLLAREQPLKSEPWTWLWGEINPRAEWRSKPLWA